MANIPIQKGSWSEFFQDVSRNLQNHPIDVEVAGREFGDQFEEEGVRLDGVSFNEKDDLIFIHTDDLDHVINGPAEVNVTSQGSIIECVSVRDKDGNVHLVHFRQVALLPSRLF
ncbi:MAG: DUF5335 family protein [Bdellovibrionales bacterium]|nr:DUF5335 family protein [Bdellovibrionales bacterium]